MNEGSELDLLMDLSKLLKKYGPETFDRLGEQLSAPEFVAQLTGLLSGMARIARAVPANCLSPERKPPSQKERHGS